MNISRLTSDLAPFCPLKAAVTPTPGPEAVAVSEPCRSRTPDNDLSARSDSMVFQSGRQSLRSAAIGSSRVARIPGITQAAIPTTSSNTATPMSISGLAPPVPATIAGRTVATATAPTSPIRSPSASCRKVGTVTAHQTWRGIGYARALLPVSRPVQHPACRPLLQIHDLVLAAAE
jgi:hypothetical protein